MDMNRVEQISQSIEDDIRQCRWLPGNKLPGQLALMRHFDVSRTCLREAITSLEVKGLVTTRHGSGCYVNNLFESQFAEPMSGIEINSVTLQLSVMEMRLVLEVEAVQYVCERATDDELAAIDVGYKAMMQAKGTALQKAKSDLNFHMLIAESCHNLIIVSLAQLFYRHFFNAIYSTLFKVAGQDSALSAEMSAAFSAQHHAIHAAIMMRHSHAAKVATQEHIRYSMVLLERQV
tara:strand:- start:1255 stop:1956 length:702 start_codon:yes stop_codon:yes gene_type:complete